MPGHAHPEWIDVQGEHRNGLLFYCAVTKDRGQVLYAYPVSNRD